MKIKHLVNEIKQRIYFEETDAGGVVYFGNISRFIEKGFTEWFRQHVRSLGELNKEYGIFLVVSSTNQKFLKTIRYDEEITIRTQLSKIKYFSITFQTQVLIGDTEHYLGETTLTPVHIETKQPIALPKEVILATTSKEKVNI